jgi:hypothetical protein
MQSGLKASHLAHGPPLAQPTLVVSPRKNVPFCHPEERSDEGSGVGHRPRFFAPTASGLRMGIYTQNDNFSSGRSTSRRGVASKMCSLLAGPQFEALEKACASDDVREHFGLLQRVITKRGPCPLFDGGSGGVPLTPFSLPLLPWEKGE